MVKRQTLDYNSDELTQNLKKSAGKGVDAFFPSPSPTSPTIQPKEKKATVRKVRSMKAFHTKEPIAPASNAPSVKTTLPVENKGGKIAKAIEDVKTSRSQDVTNGVTTSLIQDINKKLWREIIEETETHNSSLRMSAREREHIEDVVRALKRKYKIKTSMNEIARLGLLFLIHDFKKRGEQSIIAEVKKS